MKAISEVDTMTMVGFLGLGRMGAPMARHLVEAGHRVIGVDPAASARDRAAEFGVEVTDDPAAVSSAPLVMSSLPDTPQVEEVYLGGLLEHLAPGTLCLDLSTLDVESSRRIAASASARGIDFLDCPVSGTSMHAEAGTLAIMVGGDPKALERGRRFLEPFAKSIHHLGPNGAGLEMKLITNRLLTTHLVAIAEAILEIENASLDVGTCLEMLRASAVPRLLDYKAEPMSQRDHRPLFTVDLMSKDLGLAQARRPPGPVTATAAAILAEAQNQGWGASDIGAVIEVLSAEAEPPSAALR
ncbi:MAG: NAD(P)-dependent oxidoreductase [Acidimicrobiia bacterium]